MRASKIHYFLFVAVCMLAAKPFVGFHAIEKHREVSLPTICVKAFTKRKLEYVAGSQFDVNSMQKQLAVRALGSLVTPFDFVSKDNRTSRGRNLNPTGYLPDFLPRYILCRSLLI